MTIRAIFFDAVGTILHPEPDAAQVYADFGLRYGSSLERDEIRRRFRAAFRQQETIDADFGYRTDEARERRRWQAIVTEVLSDIPEIDRCFADLWEHFAAPASWRCDPGVQSLFEKLSQRGFELGVASNFDSRLRTVVAGKAELRGVQYLCISSELGARKPAAAFFEATAKTARKDPGEILFIGDDLVNDYRGAAESGMKALLLDPQGKSGLPEGKLLRSLSELRDMV